VPYVAGAECIDVSDMSCVEKCPVDCIYEGDRKFYINPRNASTAARANRRSVVVIARPQRTGGPPGYGAAGP
jgi:NAD-dependent dihydropyrimidine dehydrogenase PreA subunit